MDELLLSLLRERDSLQKLPFEGLIESINEYKGRLESSLLTLESLKFKRQHRQSSSIEAMTDSPPSSASPLHQKLVQLKEERAELYKQQGLHATQVLTLNDQLRAKDTVLSQLQGKLRELEEKLKAEEAVAREVKRRFKEKEMEAKAVGDELVALHLEMLRLDAAKAEKVAGTGEALPNSPDICSMPLISIACEKELVAPHQYPITAVSSVPSKRLLLTGSEDQKIILYDLTRISTRSVLKWPSINGAIVALAAGESGVVASCAAYDQEVTLWSAETGRVIGTLPYKSDENCQILLKFDGGNSGRLWMAQGNTVRLWDTSRSMLLRSWQQLGQEIRDIMPDASRPDRAWFFGAEGGWGLLNGMTGKVDKQGILPVPIKLISCNREAVLVFEEHVKRLVGYNYAFEGIFEVELDLDDAIECIALHPTRNDLIAVCSASLLEVIKISPDNWAPQRTRIPVQGVGSLQWGPEETDPISKEPVCKLAAIAYETRAIKLFSIK